ncbi:ABC transporter, substrate-binding protein, family 3 [Bacteriovorax sp. BAL6_X]|uniref:substrate-binding periplasmic protein n=1 Tax=Bacteriovorax sp. BAL6_X TaxID=1201290 RepID=UPI00038586E3|nr:transporter substrate-binding domain-containing protein [Bacteriovorax sp. BAL6_X]EPZ52077.1 ABC transporter, substrate-binding protein, family 3 [Bacteriovorax sp. BAL6_X]
MNSFIKFLIAFSFSISIFAIKDILVGAYHFPPFYIKKHGAQSGVLFEIIEELNKVQNKYRFKIIETSARRRYRDFTSNQFDMILFESPKWGWRERHIDYVMTPPFSFGGEKVIALKEGRNQTYLKQLEKKTILLFDGYHYGFLDYKINKKFDAKIIYTNSHEGNILSLLKGRGDIAIVTESYLNIFFEKNSEVREKLIISEHYDQKYDHRVLLTKSSRISKDMVMSLLRQIKDRSCCRKLFKF